MTLQERLMRKTVVTDACWLWTGCKSDGHGQICVNYKMIGTHRVSWELFRGPIPEGLCVLHKCDVRNCVNPDHLFLGTKRDNAVDCMNKGRHSRGERNGQARLTESDVLAIFAELKGGKSQNAIARERGVCQYTIYAIANGINWKHLTNNTGT